MYLFALHCPPGGSLICSETTPKVRMPDQMSPPARPNLRVEGMLRGLHLLRGVCQKPLLVFPRSARVITFWSSCWLSSLWSLLGDCWPFLDGAASSCCSTSASTFWVSLPPYILLALPNHLAGIRLGAPERWA